jgi:hypothetical protein
MKVEVHEGRLMDMSKDMPAERSSGENVGVLCFTADTARAIAGRADALIAAGHEKAWLGTAVREVAKERPIQAVDIAGLAWGEIDSAYDLEHVRRNVWPRIRRDSSPPRRVARAVAMPLLAFGLFSLVGYTWLNGHGDSTDWDTSDVEYLAAVELSVDDRTQRWWMLSRDGDAETTVHGPGPVRIESRYVLGPTPNADAPYVIEVALDGQVIDLFKHATRHDPGARVGDEPVGTRKRIEIDVPPGAHTLQARLLSSAPAATCLLRVREPAVEPEPEPDP